MDNPTPALFGRKDFLLRVVEQFRVLAAEITERHPDLRVEAHAATDKAALTIAAQGEDEHIVRIVARFDNRSDAPHKLVLRWEDAAGNVNKLIGLTFTETPLDAVSGLNGRADERDEDKVSRPSVYARDPSYADMLEVHEAIKRGDIEGFICDILNQKIRSLFVYERP
jgi:hypothetical protein